MDFDMEDGSPLPVDEEGFPVKETFHVDTHRLCFVCLEDIPVPLSPRQLNSEVASGSKSLRTADKAKIINLNRLLHYLKIDRESISDCVNNSLRTEVGDVLFPEGADFSALMCENCSHVYDQLVELYEEMEMIKMQLHDSLDVFCEKLMNSSEKVPKLIKSDSSGEELSSPAGLDLVHAVAAEVIRNKAIEKCSESLQREDSAGNTTAIQSQEDPLVGLTAPSAEDTMTSISASDLTNDELYMVQTFILPIMTDIPQERDTNNLVVCCICPREAESVFGKDLLFHRHITCCHLDYLFQPLKLPSFSDEHFKLYCEHLMDTLIQTCQQAEKKSNQDQVPGFICNTCGDIFHEVKVLVAHLVQSHPDVFATKLLQLQKCNKLSPETLMLKKRSEIFQVEGPRFKCENCGRVFVNPSSLYRHKRKTTPCVKVDPQAAENSIGDARPYICNQCGLSFKSNHGRKYHVKRIHLGIDHNRDRISCNLCGKTMSKSSLGRHKSTSCRVRKGHKNTPYEASMSQSNSEADSHEFHELETSNGATSLYSISESLKIEVVEGSEVGVPGAIVEYVNPRTFPSSSRRNVPTVSGKQPQQLYTLMTGRKPVEDHAEMGMYDQEEAGYIDDEFVM